MAATARARRTPSFFEHVKFALETFDDPVALGEQSPLAAPYFLGSVLHGTEATAQGRGQALQREITLTLESLWGGPLPDAGEEMLAGVEEESDQGGRYDCLILELNYIKERFRPAPRNQSEIYNDILHISRPTHDRHLRAAVERLGATLLLRLRPAVRPEQPAMAAMLVGRDTLQAEMVAHLQAGRAVSLTGAGGMGKTSLGAAVADDWHSPAVFWYTFRPTFNDQLENLLFALGAFLHNHGASTLWHQLIADGGRIKDAALAVGLAARDLQSLAAPPLLCFDELDFLRAANLDQPDVHHVQLLEFLDSLRGETAMLLIGQRAFWESDALIALDGLSEAHLAELLTTLDVPHTPGDVTTLHEQTGGNPRLAELCIALYEAGEADSFGGVLQLLPLSIALLPLWHRLERRLPRGERRLLQALSVFRSSAPADVWQREGTIEDFDHLVRRRLIRPDDLGGVTLMPALREIVYSDQAIETREAHHMAAAGIRAERGDYTAAAHHLVEAGQADAAVELWYANRQGEINRGQAAAALTIFEHVSQRRLTGKPKKQILLLRSELYQMMGEPEKVIDEIEMESWSPDEEESIDAALLQGKALGVIGQVEASRRHYSVGIGTATRLLDGLTRTLLERSMSQMRERDLRAAWYDVDLTTHHTEMMKGTLSKQSGDLDRSWRHYELALELATKLDYRTGVARAHLHLANVASRQRKSERAFDHFERAIETYNALGDRVGCEVTRTNLAAAFIDARRWSQAVNSATKALGFFEQMKDSYWIAVNASNLAESYVELGDLQLAEEYARRVLTEEEPYMYPYALFNLGRIKMKSGQSDAAVKYLKEALAIAARNQDSYLAAFTWEELGHIYANQGDTDQSFSAYGTALELFQQLNIEPKVSDIERVLTSTAVISSE